MEDHQRHAAHDECLPDSGVEVTGLAEERLDRPAVGDKGNDPGGGKGDADRNDPASEQHDHHGDDAADVDLHDPPHRRPAHPLDAGKGPDEHVVEDGEEHPDAADGDDHKRLARVAQQPGDQHRDSRKDRDQEQLEGDGVADVLPDDRRVASDQLDQQRCRAERRQHHEEGDQGGREAEDAEVLGTEVVRGDDEHDERDAPRRHLGDQQVDEVLGNLAQTNTSFGRATARSGTTAIALSSGFARPKSAQIERHKASTIAGRSTQPMST